MSKDDGGCATITGPIERFHLKRDGSGRFLKRAFIPGITPNPLMKNEPGASSAADFIALPSAPPPSASVNTLLRYPRIKQIRPNDNKSLQKKKKKAGAKTPE